MNTKIEKQLADVRRNGGFIKYVKNPSLEVQLAAVRQDGYAIQYIENPSLEVQLEAIRQVAFAMKYINNPSKEVQLEAVKQSGYAIQFVKNPSEEVQLEAAKNMRLDNFFYDISIKSEDDIHIGCLTASLKGWLLYENYEEYGVYEISAVKVKQLLKEYFE